MKKKNLIKKIVRLENRINKLEAKPKPTVNVVGYQQTLTNDDVYNEYDECPPISWVDAKKKK